MFSRGQADHIFAVLLLLAAAKSPEMTVKSNVTGHVSTQTFDNFCLYHGLLLADGHAELTQQTICTFTVIFRRLGVRHT